MELSKKIKQISQQSIFGVEPIPMKIEKPKAKKPKAKKPKKKPKVKKLEKKNRVITVTFGDSGENHVGNQQIGTSIRWRRLYL